LSKIIYGLYEPETDKLVAVFFDEEDADIFAADWDLVLEEYEVDDDFEPFIDAGAVN
jgi:hypothetical protein